MKVKSKKSKYPSASTVGYDYGYQQSVLSMLRKPNKFICGFCCAQAPTNHISHQVDCPAKGVK